MTKSQYRELRNDLMNIACAMDINTIEYANINKRIRWIWDNRL